MNWLVRLKQNSNTPNHEPTKTTETLFVVSVGTPLGTFENSQIDLHDKDVNPANDGFLLVSPTGDLSLARVVLFTERGLSLHEAETEADRLFTRDAQRDDRRLCLECAHLSGTVTTRRCSQWRALGLSSAAIPADLSLILQRCSEFDNKLETTP